MKYLPHIFVLLATLVLASPSARACTCSELNASKLLDQSTYVFTATVVSVTLDEAAPHDRQMRLTVRTNEVIKGKPEKTMTVYGPAHGTASCGYSVSVGNEHLFVLDAALSGNSCTGNGELGAFSCLGIDSFKLLQQFRQLKEARERKTSNQPLHHDAPGALASSRAVRAGERRR
jgi:hypothetical protein